MKRLPLICVPALLSVALIACGASGLGKGVRQDVITTMAKAEAPVSGCYEEALKRNRNLKSVIELAFTAAATTGTFGGFEVLRDEVGDDDLAACLQSKVGELSLASPQKTTVSITYPFSFTPSN